MSESLNRVGLAALPDKRLLERESCYSEALVGDLVKEALLQAGLGCRSPKAPLADIIRPGTTVLLKPNWVLHYNQSGATMDCMITHPTFVLAVLREVLAANPGRVIIADAPIQSCHFDSIATPEWRRQVERIATCPVEILDFRKTIVREGGLGEGLVPNPREDTQYVLFDLESDSLLEQVSTRQGRFRNTSYNPDEMTKAHRPGRHRYVLCREAFDADVVLNLPKLKAHRKAGITAALKNLVGINGDKDYLPHHRLGGSALGGDCYPGFSPLKRVAEFCLDNANRRIGTESYQRWVRPVSYLLDWQKKFGDRDLEGSWHGNDTTWRMTLDLNRLALYGRADGILSDQPLRKIYSITDAIIAGERDGPLAPTPVNLGVVTFASSSPYADLVHSALMRFDWNAIPLVRESFRQFRYGLTDTGPQCCEVRVGGRCLPLEELAAEIGLPFRPPRGWQGCVELSPGAVPVA